MQNIDIIWFLQLNDHSPSKQQQQQQQQQQQHGPVQPVAATVT
jgi:hypothetical protein